MIPDPPAIGLFVVAALALLLVPGPAVLYVVARSIDQGRRARRVWVPLRKVQPADQRPTWEPASWANLRTRLRPPQPGE